MSFPRLLTRALGTALLAAAFTACATPDGDTQAGQRVQTATVTARTGPATLPARDPKSGLPFIAVRDLPPEGRRTLQLIRVDGPFPYRKDGSVFGNRERLLPRRASGGYREYTVPTPGEGDRGARRIVCAALPQPDAECYYTGDHYSTFRRIRP